MIINVYKSSIISRSYSTKCDTKKQKTMLFIIELAFGVSNATFYVYYHVLPVKLRYVMRINYIKEIRTVGLGYGYRADSIFSCLINTIKCSESFTPHYHPTITVNYCKIMVKSKHLSNTPMLLTHLLLFYIAERVRENG